MRSLEIMKASPQGCLIFEVAVKDISEESSAYHYHGGSCCISRVRQADVAVFQDG